MLPRYGIAKDVLPKPGGVEIWVVSRRRNLNLLVVFANIALREP